VTNAFTPPQVEALASLASILGDTKWVLIGATAIRCRLSLQRRTFDLDLAVGASTASVEPELLNAGWTRDPKMVQRWVRSGATVDLVHATQGDIDEGVTSPLDGVELTVIGFDLAYEELDMIDIGAGMRIPVARVPALVLLKAIAWQDRPHEREKDLEDIFFLWSNALPDDDDRRFDPRHPLRSTVLEHDDQGAFFVGWELGKVAKETHQHWMNRFLDAMRHDEGERFVRFVRASRVAGDSPEDRVRARLNAFDQGLRAGIAEQAGAPPTPTVVTAPQVSLERRSTRETLAAQIHTAIDEHRVIRFMANGAIRVAEPHVLGVKNGELQILTWQTGGTSRSGELPGWRTFELANISRLDLAAETFAGPRSVTNRGRSNFDRHIAVVRRRAAR
jgi:predicted nucleotidyltransferase